jgi:hypothetical protein
MKSVLTARSVTRHFQVGQEKTAHYAPLVDGLNTVVKTLFIGQIELLPDLQEIHIAITQIVVVLNVVGVPLGPVKTGGQLP